MSEATEKIADVFARLARSKFRSRQKLRAEEKAYLVTKGLGVIERHAADFIRTRLAPADPPNDGKQTPWRGHPVFVAQHATATCCRTCLEKWHSIPKGRELSNDEKHYVIGVIAKWLRREWNSETRKPEKELELF